MTQLLAADQRDFEGSGALAWAGANATLSRDTVAPITGAASLKAVSTIDGLMFVNPSPDGMAVAPGVKVFRVAAQFKGPAGRAMQLWVRRFHPGLGTWTDSVHDFTSTGDAQDIEGHVITEANTPAVGFYVLDPASTIGDSYWLDEVSFEDILNYPQMIVEVAFGAGPTDESPTWTDISEWCFDIKTHRGRQRTTEAFRAGTVTVTVDNSDRRFDPSNEDSPYWPNVKPNKQIRIRARYPAGDSGTVYPVFFGLVDAWPIWWQGELGTASVHATDRLKAWEQHDLGLTPYAVQVMADAPMAYWPLNETDTDDKLQDISGNRRHGRYYGSPDFEQLDPFRQFEAVDFGTWRLGNKGAGVVPRVEFGAAGMAMECWFRVRQLQGASLETAHWIFGTRAEDSSSYITKIAISKDDPASSGGEPSGGRLEFFVPFQQLDSGDLRVDDGDWHHVVGQRLVSGDMELWLDGVLIDSASPGAPVDLAPNLTTIGNFAPASYFGPGGVDQVAVFDHSLTSDRIQAHYAARTSWANDRSGDRVDRVLDVIGIPTAERNVDTGKSLLQALPRLEGKALGHLQTVAASEGGSLFIQADGKVRFRGRHAFLSPPYSVSQHTFSDADDGNLRYQDPDFDYDEQTIANVIAHERRGGSPQEWRDQSSIDAYGHRHGPSLTNLENRTDAQVSSLAWLDLQRHKDPFLEIPTITLKPFAERNMWDAVLGMELEDRVSVIATPPGGGDPIEKQMRVQGIAHDITSDPLNWVTKLDLTTAEPVPSWWVLGTSELGIDTTLGA